MDLRLVHTDFIFMKLETVQKQTILLLVDILILKKLTMDHFMQMLVMQVI